MKFSVEDLKNVVAVNNSIIGNQNLRKDGPLSYLTFVIQNGILYTVVQGSKNLSTLAMLNTIGETEEPDGVYAIDGGKFSKTLSECVEEVDLIFINNETNYAVELKTEFGVIKFSVYRVEDISSDTRFSQIIPLLLEQKAEVEANGEEVTKETWLDVTKIASVERGDGFVQNPFIFERNLVGMELPFFILRYKTELPINFGTELDIVRVLTAALTVSDDTTKVDITTDGRSTNFRFSSNGLYLIVRKVSTYTQRIKEHTWEQNESYTGTVNLETLRRLVRISSIFTDFEDDIEVEWDFENKTAHIKNQGVDNVSQSGINTQLTFNHNSDTTDVISTGINGKSLIKLLTYTEDDDISVEIIPSERKLHIVFTEGDLYVFYKALS